MQLDLFPPEPAHSEAALPHAEVGPYVRPEVEPLDPAGRGFYGYTVGLVACSKSKAPGAAPARDFYRGQLFRKSVAYCERMCQQWFILSAEYGLVHPEQVLQPYEKTLTAAPLRERMAWGERVLEQFRERPDTSCVWHFILLAGRAYRESLPPAFFTLGTHSLPLKGCAGLGEQMARLDRLVAQWDSWRSPPVLSRVQPLAGAPGWEIAVEGSTLWLREGGGAWQGPIDFASEGLRARAQFWQHPGRSREEGRGWADYFPGHVTRALHALFQQPEQHDLVPEADVARRGRRKP